jgi:hypothetical protein
MVLDKGGGGPNFMPNPPRALGGFLPLRLLDRREGIQARFFGLKPEKKNQGSHVAIL